MAQSKTSLDSALELAERGLLVFPLKANAKAPPLLPQWQTAATDAPDKVERWFRNAKANIGIHCAGLIVVDVDVKKRGHDTLLELELEGYYLPPTLEAATPTGGRHLYYRFDAGVRNGVDVLGPGLDIRSNRGYVVAPGSVTEAGEYTWHRDTPIQPAPTWLVERCTRVPEPVEKSAVPASIDEEQAALCAREWLETAAPAVEGEGGNDRTFRVACRVRDFGVSEDAALEVLDSWNERCSPPWMPDELARVISHAYRYASNPPGVLSSEAMFEGLIDTSAPAPPAAEASLLTHVGDAEIVETWHRDYLVKGWLDRGGDAQLFGSYGSGKTFNALHLSAHIAAGKSWFDHQVRQGGVLYLLYEGHSGLRFRLAALKKQYPDWDWKNLPFAVVPMNAPLVDLKTANQNELPGRQRLQEAIKQFHTRYGTAPSLIVCDTYSRAIAGSASDEELAGKFANMVGALRSRYGCAFLRIHHPGHGDKTRGRGAYAVAAGVDVDIRVDGGIIETLKERDAPTTRIPFKLTQVELGVDQDGDPVTSMIVERGLDETEGLTERQETVYVAAKILSKHGQEAITRKAVRTELGMDKGRHDGIWRELVEKRVIVATAKRGWYRVGLGAGDEFLDTS